MVVVHRTFRKLPVEIDAACWPTDAGSAHIIRFNDNGGSARAVGSLMEDWNRAVILIDTLEGTMTALPGDYIIRGVKGEFYPCKPDIFSATYEECA